LPCPWWRCQFLLRAMMGRARRAGCPRHTRSSPKRGKAGLRPSGPRCGRRGPVWRKLSGKLLRHVGTGPVSVSGPSALPTASGRPGRAARHSQAREQR
jgi:hypothetical protein